MSRLQRRFDRFLADPSSIRNAVGAIIGFTVAVVFLGAVAIRVFDSSEYPTYGRALWFTLQTVTTVGYGDATPSEPAGKIVATVVMLTSIGLITVITAAVTSTFVAAAQRSATHADRASDDPPASLDDVVARLERIEQALDATPRSRDDDPGPD